MTMPAELDGTLLGERMRLAAALEQLHRDMEEVLGPTFGEVGSRVQTLFGLLRRLQLGVGIRCWHIPWAIAYWLSQHWPRRWLPELKPELWERDEKETVT